MRQSWRAARFFLSSPFFLSLLNGIKYYMPASLLEVFASSLWTTDDNYSQRAEENSKDHQSIAHKAEDIALFTIIQVGG